MSDDNACSLRVLLVYVGFLMFLYAGFVISDVADENECASTAVEAGR